MIALFTALAIGAGPTLRTTSGPSPWHVDVRFADDGRLAANGTMLAYVTSAATDPHDVLIVNGERHNIVDGFTIYLPPGTNHSVESTDPRSRRVFTAGDAEDVDVGGRPRYFWAIDKAVRTWYFPDMVMVTEEGDIIITGTLTNGTFYAANKSCIITNGTQQCYPNQNNSSGISNPSLHGWLDIMDNNTFVVRSQDNTTKDRKSNYSSCRLPDEDGGGPVALCTINESHVAFLYFYITPDETLNYTSITIAFDNPTNMPLSEVMFSAWYINTWAISDFSVSLKTINCNGNQCLDVSAVAGAPFFDKYPAGLDVYGNLWNYDPVQNIMDVNKLGKVHSYHLDVDVKTIPTVSTPGVDCGGSKFVASYDFKRTNPISYYSISNPDEIRNLMMFPDKKNKRILYFAPDEHNPIVHLITLWRLDGDVFRVVAQTEVQYEAVGPYFGVGFPDLVCGKDVVNPEKDMLYMSTAPYQGLTTNEFDPAQLALKPAGDTATNVQAVIAEELELVEIMTVAVLALVAVVILMLAVRMVRRPNDSQATFQFNSM
jgi:hypothetical protein